MLMTQLLVKLFIKDADNITDLKVRQRYGTLAGAVGIFCNVMLCVAKFIAGVITSSISIIADAFNNLSDAASSVVTLIGFRMAGKPADLDHPYGHGRIEYISGLFVSIAIILMGFELFKSSVEKIIHPVNTTFQLASIIILVMSVLVKFWMFLFNKKLGATIESETMKATSLDSLSDCVATSAVLVGLIFHALTNKNVDGFIGAIVSILVLKAGFDAAKDTLQPLLGQPPKPEFVAAIKSSILKYREIVGIHDMVVHDYGPGRVMISLHAEIPKTLDMIKAHDIIDAAENEIKETYGCDICIHMDPIATNDTYVIEMRQMAQRLVKEIHPKMTLHDFRITNGPLRTNFIFDVVVPFDCKLKDEEIKEQIDSKLKQQDETYYSVVTLDKNHI